jgi:hypothetical protein
MDPETVSASGGSNHPLPGLVTAVGAAARGRHKRTPGVDN